MKSIEYHVSTNRQFNPNDHDNSAWRDAGDAAAAINRRLMESGRTHERHEVEREISECSDYIRDMLTIEEIEVEIDHSARQAPAFMPGKDSAFAAGELGGCALVVS